MIQRRGPPSTHDIALGSSVFASLFSGDPTKIPEYDKSAYHGRGDRIEESQWGMANQEGEPRIKVVIFEGWCVGFKALGEEGVRRRWEAAVQERKRLGQGYRGQLGLMRLQDLEFVDSALAKYGELTR